MTGLIILGASVRAAAWSARRAGFQPYAIDQFADRDLQAVGSAVRIERYPHDFLAAMQAAPQAPWLYTGGLENEPQLVDRLAALRPLWGNPGDVLRRVRDPWQLASAADQAGFEMPTTCRELSSADWRDPSARWLVKPRRSSGGYKIRVAASRTARGGRGSYFQQRIPGISCGAAYVADERRCLLLGLSRQLHEPEDDFRYRGSIVDVQLWEQHAARLQRLGESLAAAFSLRGLFNVDLIIDQERMSVLEVNPRYSASIEILERATGIACLLLHAAVFDPGRRHTLDWTVIPPPAQSVGKAIVYAPCAGLVTPHFDQLVDQWSTHSQWPGIADLPHTGDLLHRDQPLCTVFADGDDPCEVERTLQDRTRQVQAAFTGSLPG